MKLDGEYENKMKEHTENITIFHIENELILKINSKKRWDGIDIKRFE